MTEVAKTIRICHLDDEPKILSFIPRRLHLEVVRNIDRQATLTEPTAETDGTFSFLIEFKSATGPIKIEYTFFLDVEAFLDAERGFKKPLLPYESNVAAIFDLRIGDEKSAGYIAFNNVREMLAPRTNVDWIFLTAYIGNLDVNDPDLGDRIFGKPPNRNDLFIRLSALLANFGPC